MTLGLHSARIMPSGQTLLLAFSLDGRPIPIRTLDTALGPTIRVNGGAPLAVTNDELVWGDYEDGYSFKRICWAAYKLPTAILPSDTVSVSLPAGLAADGSGNASAAVTDRTAINYAGGAVFDSSPPSGRTLRVGLHPEPAWYSQPICVYSNIARGGDTIWSNYSSDTPQTLHPNPDGYPTVANAANVHRLIQWSSGADNVPRGYELGPHGRYVLMWDGPGDVILTTNQPRYGGHFAPNATSIGSEAVELRRITGGNDNRRVYDFPPDRDLDDISGQTFLSPWIRAEIVAQSSFQPVSNVRIYPPDVAPDGVAPASIPKFRPRALEMIQGMKVLRSMTWFGINSNGWSQPGDLPRQSQMAFAPMYSRPRVKVARIEPMLDPGSPYTIWPDNPAIGLVGPLYKVVTETPHGFSHGCLTRFENATGHGVLRQSVTLDNGNVVELNLSSCMIYVVDATSFVVDYEATRPFTPVTPTDLYALQDLACCPVEDFCELVNAADPDCVAWLNIATAAADDTVVAVAQKAAATLQAGHPVLLELSNEPWNWGFYLQRKYLAMGGKILWPDQPGEIRLARFLVVRSQQIRKIFRDAWIAAGRAEPVNLVINVWTTLPSWAETILAVARDYDIQGRYKTDPGFAGPCLDVAGDGIGLTFYSEAAPTSSRIPASTLATMTFDRHADILDAFFLYPEHALWVQGVHSHRAMLTSSDHPNAANLRIYGYEGAWAYQGLYDTGESNQDIVNSMASIYHPRCYQRALKWFDVIDGIFDLACFYVGWQGYVPEISGSGHVVPKLYGIYKGYSQREGAGDGSDGRTDNRALIVDANGLAKAPPLENLALPIRKAISSWNAAPFPDPIALAAPGNLAATGGEGRIDLSWDPVPTAIGYRLERKVGSGDFIEITVLAANATSYADTGLAWGLTCAYRVRAFNLQSTSPYSASIAAATSSPVATVFVRADRTTLGSWKGVYGASGYSLAGDTTTLSNLSFTGRSDYVWLHNSADPRAVQRAGSEVNRVVATWYTLGSLSARIDLGAGQTSQLAAYFCDWDQYLGGRTQLVEIVDNATSQVIDRQDVSGFAQGVTLVWNVAGDVTLRVTNTKSGSNALLQAIFLDPVAVVNQPPTANPNTATTNQGTPVTIDVVANDTDPNGDPLTISAVTQPAHGGVTFVGRDVTYMPNAAFHGVDTFTYTVSDGQGGSATGTVTVTVLAVNRPPTANPNTATTNQGTPVTIDVVANDSDPDNDSLTVTSVTHGVRGAVTFSGRSVTYAPITSFTGVDTFTYTVSDGQGGSATGTVTVTVLAVNRPPTANPNTATTNQGTPVTIDVVANDSDPDNDSLTVTSVTHGVHGAVTFSGRSVTYAPITSFTGVDTFTYTVSDGQGGSATGTVTVTVLAVNRPPLAYPDVATTTDGKPVTIPVLANDTDLDGNTLTIVAVTQGGYGSVNFNSRVVTYIPRTGYQGTDTFTYTVSDGQGGAATGGVTVTVGGRGGGETGRETQTRVVPLPPATPPVSRPFKPRRPMGRRGFR